MVKIDKLKQVATDMAKGAQDKIVANRELAHTYKKALSVEVEVIESTIKGIKPKNKVVIKKHPTEHKLLIGGQEALIESIIGYSEDGQTKFSWGKAAMAGVLTCGIGAVIAGKNGKKIKGRELYQIQTSIGAVQVAAIPGTQALFFEALK